MAKLSLGSTVNIATIGILVFYLSTAESRILPYRSISRNTEDSLQKSFEPAYKSDEAYRNRNAARGNQNAFLSNTNQDRLYRLRRYSEGTATSLDSINRDSVAADRLRQSLTGPATGGLIDKQCLMEYLPTIVSDYTFNYAISICTL